jgi:hypothetical protein
LSKPTDFRLGLRFSAMRKRTKLSPINQKDLMALIELGLIEMQNDKPALTNEGMLAIAHSTGPTGPNESERGE